MNPETITRAVARVSVPIKSTWVFVAVLCAQSAILFVFMKPWMAGDSPAYLDLANSMNLGIYGSVVNGRYVPDVLRPPGYPALLWLMNDVSRLPLPVVIISQFAAIISTLLLIDRMVFQSRSIAFRVLAIGYPFVLLYGAYVMTEAWTMLLFTASIILTFTNKQVPARFVLAGLCAGLAALFRTDMLLLGASLTFVLLIKSFTDRSLKGTGNALILAVSTCVSLAPYAVWNARTFDHYLPTPAASAFGNSFYTAIWQERLPLSDINAFYGGDITPRLRDSGYLEEISRLNRSIGAPELTPPDNPIKYETNELRIASTKVFGKAAFVEIQRDPSTYGWHVTKNVVLLWNSTSSLAKLPKPLALAAMLISWLIFLLGVIGWYAAIQQRRQASILFLGLFPFLLPYLLHIPAHLEARYTATLRPLLLAYAAFGLTWAWQSLMRSLDRGLERQL